VSFETANSSGRKVALALLAALSLAYFLSVIVPGRLAVTDEVFFKAAGRNWAATGHFAAPELTGRLTEGPPLSEIYFAQPPIYTFLFGVYIKLLGFSPRLCIAYDAMIHLLLMWSAMIFARAVYRADWRWAALSGALLATLGTAGRPDELGIVFAMWAAVAFRSRLPDPWRVTLGGVLLGLCVCTSLGAFLFLSPLVLLELFTARTDRAGRIADLAVASLAGLSVAATCVAPILIAHPAAYRQLIEHAGEQSSLLSALTGEQRNSSLGFVALWKSMMRYGYNYGLLIGGPLLFAALCGWLTKFYLRPVYSRIAVLLASWVVLFIAMPGKYPYFWFQGCLLLIACVALAAHAQESLSPWRGRFLLALGLVLWMAASAQSIRWGYILWTLPADQKLSVNDQRVREEVPPGEGVMTTDYWWDLADRDTVYDLVFSDPGVRAVDYIVLSGNGSGRAGVPTDYKEKYKPGFRPIFDQLNATPPHISRLAISHSGYGFGAYVLKKYSASPGAAAQK
jgi:hypothetical protein